MDEGCGETIYVVGVGLGKDTHKQTYSAVQCSAVQGWIDGGVVPLVTDTSWLSKVTQGAFYRT